MAVQKMNRKLFLLTVAVRILLVMVISVQVLFLSRCEVLRLDLTEDGLFSLTGSTKSLLSGLEQRVLAKAFFSRTVPPAVGPVHERIRTLLDEYEARSDGRFIVEYVDPAEDQGLREEADRLGIQGVPIQTATEDQLSVRPVYQGLRLRAGDRQKVLDLAQIVVESARGGLVPSKFEYELTNTLAELVVAKRPKVLLIAKSETPAGNPFMQQQQQGPSYQNLKGALEGRFQVEEQDTTPEGKIADDTDLLIYVKPKDLTDLQRFALDQYLVKGGKAILFIDANDFNLGRHWKMGESVTGLEELLPHFGLEVKKELVAEFRQDCHLTFPVQQRIRLQNRWVPVGYIPVQYPYWARAVNRNWAELGDEYQSALPGMNPDDPAVAKLDNAFFFWAAPVALKAVLPEGVTGATLVRTSPNTLVESVPQSVDPGMDQAGIRTFLNQLTRRYNTEKPAQQALVARVQGRFASFFQGKKLPEPPAKTEPAAAGAAPGGMPPGMMPPGLPGGEDVDRDGVPQAEEPAASQPAASAPAASQPAASQPASQPAVKPLEFVARTDREGSLVVVGDATLVEDSFFAEQNDVIYRANYALVLNLVDSLALDPELVELRTRNTKYRQIRLVEQREDETPEQLRERRRARAFLLRWSNNLIPALLVAFFGLGGYAIRRGRKSSFVRSLG